MFGIPKTVYCNTYNFEIMTLCLSINLIHYDDVCPSTLPKVHDLGSLTALAKFLWQTGQCCS